MGIILGIFGVALAILLLQAFWWPIFLVGVWAAVYGAVVFGISATGPDPNAGAMREIMAPVSFGIAWLVDCFVNHNPWGAAARAAAKEAAVLREANTDHQPQSGFQGGTGGAWGACDPAERGRGLRVYDNSGKIIEVTPRLPR